MRCMNLLASWAIALPFCITTASSCVSIQPMPALPDLAHLRLSPADSAQLVRAALEGGSDSFLVDSVPTNMSWTPPSMRHMPKATYPPAARKQHLQGWVALQFIVGGDGAVEPRSVVVLRASDSIFVDAARNAILHAVFTPLLLNGRSARASARQLVEFALH